MLNRAKSASLRLSPRDSTPHADAAEDAEYAALEATLESSELGRRFLANYARQHPTPEIKLLLDAVARLESVPLEQERKSQAHGLVSELVAMSETISEMRREIGSLCLSDIPENDPIKAPCAFEQIVEASARATSDVLTALEEIQAVSRSLREKGIAVESCDRLDESTVDIYTACARREIAGQQTADALNLLRDMERRIDTLIEDWSDHETQNLLDAAKALDVSEAFETAAPGRKAETKTTNGASESRQKRSQGKPKDVQERADAQESVQACTPASNPTPRRTNRLVPENDLKAPADTVPPADEAEPADMPAIPGPLFDGQRPLERPEPLTLESLIAAQRSALFG